LKLRVTDFHKDAVTQRLQRLNAKYRKGFVMIEFTEKDGSLIFSVRVVPRASKGEIVGEHDGALKIKIAAPPVNGAANAELIKVLAKQFGVPKSAVEITGGQTAKIKQIKIFGANSEKLLGTFSL
jgi:uncharacterized protein (TIGR00251 family)